MKEIEEYAILEEILNKKDLLLLYISTPNCGVCEVDIVKTREIVKDLDVETYHIDFSKVPQVRGQLQVFSAPTIIIYYEGKEYHRQARIVDFNELRYRIEQIQENN